MEDRGLDRDGLEQTSRSPSLPSCIMTWSAGLLLGSPMPTWSPGATAWSLSPASPSVAALLLPGPAPGFQKVCGGKGGEHPLCGNLRFHQLLGELFNRSWLFPGLVREDARSCFVVGHALRSNPRHPKSPPPKSLRTQGKEFAELFLLSSPLALHWEQTCSPKELRPSR